MNEPTQTPGILAVGLGWLGTAATWIVGHFNYALGSLAGVCAIVSSLYAIYVQRDTLRRRREADRRNKIPYVDGPLVVFLISALAFSGCSLVPTERKTAERSAAQAASAASHQATIQKSMEGPAPSSTTIEIKGSSNSVSVAAVPASRTSASVVASDNGTINELEKSSENSEVSIPLGVKLALLGVGLLIVAFAVKWILTLMKQSAAGRAALEAGDEILANRIRSLRDRVGLETNEAKMADLHSQIAALESDRGRLLSKQ